MPEEHPASMVLASGSPRRKQLLAEAGYRFRVVRPNIDESALSVGGLSPCECAKGRALAKAKNVAARFPDSLVVGADTVVDCEGQVIGKPRDAKEAEEITRKLFAGPHDVITAVAIVRLEDGIEIVESDTTRVYPRKMTDGQIAEHIKSGSWREKAGAYAIQEGGDEFIERIEGSLTNVMGLPMELLGGLLGAIVD